MRKKQSNWVAAGLLTLAMFLATIYCILVYRDSVFIVGIMSLLFLASAFWLFKCISAMLTALSTPPSSIGEEQKERMNYEGMKLQGEELLRLVNTLGKGTYLNSKQTAKHLEELLAQYTAMQQSNEQLIQTLMDEQTKNAKFQVKYNQSDTGKIIAAMNDQCSRLNNSLTQCISAIQNKSITIPESQDNSQISESLHALSLELAHINSSIQTLQLQINTVSQPVAYASAAPQPVVTSPIPMDDIAIPEVKPIAEPTPVQESTSVPEPEPEPVQELTSVPEPEPEPVQELTSVPEPEPVQEMASAPEPVAASAGNGMLDQSAIDALLTGVDTEPDTVEEAPAPISEPEPAPEPVADVSSIVSDDPNKQLSPDEIAALFAALG